MITKPEEEFALVAAKLTNDELVALDGRCVSGCMIGHTYIDEECGCFYGSIAIIRGDIDPDEMRWSGWDYRDTLLSGLQIQRDDANGNTPLEASLYSIHPGDTPEDSHASAWLHNLLVGELARRAQERMANHV